MPDRLLSTVVSRERGDAVEPKRVFDLAKRCIMTAPRASQHTEEDMRMVQTGAAALFSLAALLMAGASEAGEITVMSTVAVREPYVELVPAFERVTENKLVFGQF